MKISLSTCKLLISFDTFICQFQVIFLYARVDAGQTLLQVPCKYAWLRCYGAWPHRSVLQSCSKRSVKIKLKEDWKRQCYSIHCSRLYKPCVLNSGLPLPVQFSYVQFHLCWAFSTSTLKRLPPSYCFLCTYFLKAVTAIDDASLKWCHQTVSQFYFAFFLSCRFWCPQWYYHIKWKLLSKCLRIVTTVSTYTHTRHPWQQGACSSSCCMQQNWQKVHRCWVGKFIVSWKAIDDSTVCVLRLPHKPIFCVECM